MDPFVDMNQVIHVTIEVLDPVAEEVVARRDFHEMVMIVSTPVTTPRGFWKSLRE